MDSDARTPPPPPATPAPGAARATKRISPFTEAQTELCIGAIREFRAGLSQALLYTPGTLQFERVCETTFAALTKVLEAAGSFKFGVAKCQVLINGERMETPTGLRGQLDYLEKAMNAAGTGSVKFHKELTYGEVGPFLQLLARKQLPRVEGEKVNQFLREQGIQHLEVDDLRYIELKGSEKVVSGEGTVLSDHAIAHEAVTGLVDATLSSIEKVEDAEARAQLRAEVADQFIEKNQAMLSSLMATATQRLKLTATEEQAAVAAIPPRDGQLFTSVLEVAKQLPEAGADGAWDALRRLIEQLAQPYAARAEDILAQVHLEGAPARLLPEWLVQAQASLEGATAIQRLGGILRQSPGTLLSEQMFPHIVDVLDELSVARLDAEAEQLARHVAGAAQIATKRERKKAVERLSFLLERLMEQSSAAVRVIEDALLAACTHETSDEVLTLLVEHLSRRCTHHYRTGNWQRALEHLEWIASLEEGWRLALRDEGANIARQAREALANTAFAQALPADLLAEGDKGTAVVHMLRILGATVWGGAVERIRAETDTARAQRTASRLREIGPEAARLFYIALGREADGPTALRLLELALPLRDDAALWAELQTLLHHADERVRGRALDLVVAHNDGLAVEALVAALHTESDPSHRKVWIHALTRVRDPAAEQALLDEINKAAGAVPPDETMLLPMLDVLSATGNRGVITTATTLLRPRSHTLILGASGSPPPHTIVIAAIKALAPFYRDPQVAETLDRLRKDKDPEIARLAVVCLRGIVAAEQQQAEQAVQTEAAVAPPVMPAESSVSPHKGHREFEVFEASARMATQFKAGAGVGGAAKTEAREPAAPPAGQAAAPQPAPARLEGEPALEGQKPAVEGLLGDFGLAAAVRMVGGKDGVLRVTSTVGEGRVYIRERKVICASYAANRGLAALAAIEGAQGVRFAYFPVAVTVAAEINLDIGRVQEALQAQPPT